MRGAQEFNEVWADHIDLFVEYTIAVVEDDAAAKQSVRDRFDRVVHRFGTTLETATDGRVDADGVVKAMGEHERQLVDQIELFADDDLSARMPPRSGLSRPARMSLNRLSRRRSRATGQSGRMSTAPTAAW